MIYHLANLFMALRHNPPHPSKSALTLSKFESAWFSDIKDPESAIHYQINLLNHQAYPSDIFARADNLLMFVAFAKKEKKCCHHEILPVPAQSGSPTYLLKEEGTLVANICKCQFNSSELS